MAHDLRLLAAAALVALGSTVAMAQTFSKLRGPTPIDQAPLAEPLTPEQNAPEHKPRSYPEQPPLIPHSTEGYEVSVRGNECLSCHARSRVGESQAPMISITHFADRDGQFLATVSPRRYFCTECHVPQHDEYTEINGDAALVLGEAPSVLSRPRRSISSSTALPAQ
jgi:nitrate reductase (cytochrome), electron transfer subunit